jgi:hypothetical protein
LHQSRPQAARVQGRRRMPPRGAGFAPSTAPDDVEQLQLGQTTAARSSAKPTTAAKVSMLGVAHDRGDDERQRGEHDDEEGGEQRAGHRAHRTRVPANCAPMTTRTSTHARSARVRSRLPPRNSGRDTSTEGARGDARRPRHRVSFIGARPGAARCVMFASAAETSACTRRASGILARQVDGSWCRSSSRS